jgi:ABC-type antimicrobial peptide transport system permease subunit
MIINQRFARRFYGNGNPIGRKVQGWGKSFTVIGVVKDTKFHQPNEDQRALFFVPFRQVYREDLAIAFYVRSEGDLKTASTIVRNEVRAMDPNVGVFDLTPLSEYITAALFAQKMAASLLGVLAGIALVLAAIGLYSVMAYSIAQRTHEIGIRMALGARPADVITAMIGEGMRMVSLGIVLGVLAAAAVTRLVAGMLVNVSPSDPSIFVGAALFLAVVALFAAAVPALRATRIDPNVALRCQ